MMIQFAETFYEMCVLEVKGEKFSAILTESKFPFCLLIPLDLSKDYDYHKNITNIIRCKYSHPADRVDPGVGGTKLQDKMEFCHDFQNGRCSRSLCKFIHCTSDVEAEFKKSGSLTRVLLFRQLKIYF